MRRNIALLQRQQRHHRDMRFDVNRAFIRQLRWRDNAGIFGDET